MTTDPKAPLPDNVSIALEALIGAAHEYGKKLKDDGSQLVHFDRIVRAHIAAQAREIEAFRLSNERLAQDLHNTITDWKEIEAENKRLREALGSYANPLCWASLNEEDAKNFFTCMVPGQKGYTIAKEALRQEDSE